MTALTFENPVFSTYVLAAALMVVKMMTQSWITVFRMLKIKGGYRLPEDVRKTLMNPDPSPEQLLPSEYVERSRRLHQNEVENVPIFLVAGLLWVCTGPDATLATALFGAYVLSRVVHFAIIMAEGTHDARAVAWTIGSVIVYAMSGMTLVHALRALA